MYYYYFICLYSLQRLYTVSYTHLDVYKRQVQSGLVEAHARASRYTHDMTLGSVQASKGSRISVTNGVFMSKLMPLITHSCFQLYSGTLTLPLIILQLICEPYLHF